MAAAAWGLAAGQAAEEEPLSLTLDQASSRAGADFAPAYEGRVVRVQGVVASLPVWAVDTYVLPLWEAGDHGLLLVAPRAMFEGLTPGDRVDVTGPLQRRAGLPVLEPGAITKIGRTTAPPPKRLALTDVHAFRYLGLVVTVEGQVVATSAIGGGEQLTLASGRLTIPVVLPKHRRDDDAGLDRIRPGDRVRLTGLAVQDCALPPFDQFFQILVADAQAVEVTDAAGGLPPYLLVSALACIVFVLAVWWLRERRQTGIHQTMRTLNTLGEQILAATSLNEILKKLEAVLPSVTSASGVQVFLYNRKTRTLDLVRTGRAWEPVSIELDAPGSPLNAGVAMCFRNRTLLHIPDTRRSPFFKNERRADLPRSVMFVPMFAQNELLGVMQVHRADTVRYFNSEEQTAAQHLANQVATSLRLQEQRTVREQLFRSEKLAATGQLISGVAHELKQPVETILTLSQLLLRRGPQSDARAEARMVQVLAAESQRTAEIVTRLISFGRSEDAEAKPVEINAVVSGLFKFREREWRALGLVLDDRLSRDGLFAVGAQGQLEQVFLNLLVHAEQSAADSGDKRVSVSSGVMGRRLLVEISFSTSPASPDPFGEEATTLGLSVSRGIVQSHGGDLRYERPQPGQARFEVELPRQDVAPETPETEVQSKRRLTLLLVETDAGAQRQIVSTLATKGHRVVPVPSADEAIDLARRVRFDATLATPHLAGMNWFELYERIHAHVDAFVLLTDGHDSDLAHSFADGDGFTLAKPLQDREVNRVLNAIAHHIDSLSVSRG